MATYVLTWRRNTLDVDIPEGWPTERGEMLLEIRASTHDEAKRVCDTMWWPGSGYSVHAHWEDTEAAPPRRLSEEAKQNLRRKALRRRLAANSPLFLEDEVTAHFERQPDYYGGIRP